MKRSLKNYLNVLLVVILLQMILSGVIVYFQAKHHQLEEKQEVFTKYVNLIMENLALEKDLETIPETGDLVLQNYQSIIESCKNEAVLLNITPLQQRINFVEEFLKLIKDRYDLHSRLNTILPELSDSVSYIHEHHLAYLKNSVNAGNFADELVTKKNFSKKSNEPATELDILAAAIGIQKSMLEIVEVFSRIQRGISPQVIIDDFKTAIATFYTATNTFEDYSLDAQDGLLVEELIIKGRTFEDSFGAFLDIEKSLLTSKNSFSRNRKGILDEIESTRVIQEKNYSGVTSRINLVLQISFIISFLILAVLLLLARQVMNSLTKTVSETDKIHKNIGYRIPHEKVDFIEFSFIYKTLNQMSSTIEEKLTELSNARTNLELEVANRTAELIKTNKQLQEEIHERIKNEEHRIALEERLSRAEKMEALGTLAGGVAHDLNNIFSGIVSYPEILLMDLPPESPLRGPLETIKSSGDKAAIIVQDLLTMARRGVAKQVPLDLQRVIEDFIDSCDCGTILNHHPKIELQKNLQAEITTINGSKVHLQKTLANLLSNAAESISGAGAIQIELTDEYIDTALKSFDNVTEGEYVKLSIIDNGIGIAREHQERIFEPFFTTKTMGRSGSGLGMAVVWGTVKDHGGYIDIVSKRMEGTRFDLYFPLLRGFTELDVPENDIKELYAEGESVLVIDDVQEQREIAAMMLSRLNYKVETVDSGEAAIDFLRYKSADILVLDMIMTPGIDGLETYRQILKIRADQKAIIVSGYSESDKVLEAQKLGTGAYVKKPYTIRELASAIRQELASNPQSR